MFHYHHCKAIGFFVSFLKHHPRLAAAPFKFIACNKLPSLLIYRLYISKYCLFIGHAKVFFDLPLVFPWARAEEDGATGEVQICRCLP